MDKKIKTNRKALQAFRLAMQDIKSECKKDVLKPSKQELKVLFSISK